MKVYKVTVFIFLKTPPLYNMNKFRGGECIPLKGKEKVFVNG